MKRHSILVSALIVLTLCIFAVVQRNQKPDPNEGVDIKAAMNDPELLGLGQVSVTEQGKYTGPVEGEWGDFIAQYRVNHANGQPRVIKTILSRKSFLTRRGHYVLYAHYREDGTLLQDRLVEPEPMMGAGIMVKFRLRFFDSAGKRTLEQYLREDGSLGSSIDLTTDTYKEFQHDGTTVRFVQTRLPNDEYRGVWYQRDGKTVWYTSGDAGFHILFDHDGKPFDKTFKFGKVDGTNNGFSMNGGDAPKEHSICNYVRKDGTLEYRQVWFLVFHKPSGDFIDMVSKVTVFDAAGKKPVAEYTLELREQDAQRFIKQVIIYNADDTSLVRKYREPGIRESEDVYTWGGNLVSHKDFDTSDRFQEPVADNLFHGFGMRTTVAYDADPSF